jgi:hypothetical protein
VNGEESGEIGEKAEKLGSPWASKKHMFGCFHVVGTDKHLYKCERQLSSTISLTLMTLITLILWGHLSLWRLMLVDFASGSIIEDYYSSSYRS